MIELTRLNGHKFLVNCDLIKYVEAAPDTTLTLVMGEKLLVSESCAEVAELILANQVGVLRTAWPTAFAAFRIKPALEVSSELQKKESASLDHNE